MIILEVIPVLSLAQSLHVKLRSVNVGDVLSFIPASQTANYLRSDRRWDKWIRLVFISQIVKVLSVLDFRNSDGVGLDLSAEAFVFFVSYLVIYSFYQLEA